MEQINITGKDLIRHGFECWGGYSFSLALPVENRDLYMEWESIGCFTLQLRTIWDEEEVIRLDVPEDVYHDLKYINSLELLKEFHLLLTGKPLVELDENDVYYPEELSTGLDWFYERLLKEGLVLDKPTGAIEPIQLKGTSSMELGPESLREEGFSCKNLRYELMVYSVSLDLKTMISCTNLVWEEEKGLYLEYYYKSDCACTIPLPHIRSIGDLQNLRILLTPKSAPWVQLGPMAPDKTAPE